MAQESGTISVKPTKISVYSGTVAADKDFNDKKIKAYITEFLPYQGGNLEATEVKSKVGTEDDRSGGGEGEATLTNTIEATYFDLTTNRTWPPDVRKGEQVLLFNIGDSDTYYWYSMGRNDNLRRCEKFRLAISDDIAYTKELTNDNTWYLEMNTLPDEEGNKVKQFTISTAKSDGEEFRYLFRIDGVANTLQINDDADNLILMESKEKRMLMRNTDGSYVELNKKNATLCAVEELTLKAGKMIVYDSPLLVDQQDKKDKAATKEADDIHFTAKKSFVITTPMLGIRGPKNEESGKEEPVNVTICGTLLTKMFATMCQSVVKFDPSACGENPCGESEGGGDSGSTEQALVARAMSLFSEDSGEKSSTAPNEENRPTELKTEFADGHGADEIREDFHFHDSTEPSTTAKAYEGVEIDKDTRTRTETGNEKNSVDGEAGRHMAAWDQMTAAIDRISVAIQSIRGGIDSLASQVLDTTNITDPETKAKYEEMLGGIKSATEYADKLGVEARVLGVNSFISGGHVG